MKNKICLRVLFEKDICLKSMDCNYSVITLSGRVNNLERLCFLRLTHQLYARY